MCLPCFPWTWTEYEDPMDSMPEQHVWVHDGQAWSLQRCRSRCHELPCHIGRSNGTGYPGSCLQMLKVNGPVCQLSISSHPRPLHSQPSLKANAFSLLLPHPFHLRFSLITAIRLLGLLHLAARPQKMPEAVAKSPKTPRRLKTGGEPLRQVQFLSPGSNAETKPAISSSSTSSAPFSSSTTASNGESIHVNTATPAPDNQPSSFPQLGAAPNSSLASDQWHTSVDPTQSVKLPGQPFAGGFAGGFAAPGFAPGFTCAPPQTHLVGPFSALPQASAAPFTTYVGFPPQHQPQHQPLPLQHHFITAASMADYQNAAPMPSSVNFQPPVPDTTFGPIPHVYVPRFDGGFVPAAVQVGLPSPSVAGIPVAHSSYVVAQQPAVVPQPFVGQQPVMIGGQPAAAAIPVHQMPTAVPAMGLSGVGGMPVFTGNGGQIPDVSGLGRTPGEETVRQHQFAHANKLFEPQEFKPSDDDPSRFYYVREVDGNWTQRNRFTIDHLGDCRWKTNKKDLTGAETRHIVHPFAHHSCVYMPQFDAVAIEFAPRSTAEENPMRENVAGNPGSFGP
ncbi:hypothetical protein TRIATDRAFT_272379 [Trichoderma atroviride IMI 206040]|uniref:Uncharacterized protein n=1 Tax=Hypocrea atroviridis (strain ATCC 20476 / IMI 206040) TaxID=452589 RepID=G9NNB7_HYPAI|nr:uncharacterized protein TRIATDRAFT_272379 [Trichoderma atroviride IMI 206040]EHK47566.1 hypothetical protein TRIATDRAFT_272379 [Trichoderma atroviride IMI 206040]